jgi:N-dimethylarginine dimethylaminohydrolase
MAIGAVDFTRAAVQHAAFVTALEAAGATLHRLPFIHGAYDSVFVKDPALLLERRGRRHALLAHFRHPERQCERSERARSLAHHGYEIVGDDDGPAWEGGDVVMLPSGEGLFLGHGFRSERAAAAWLERHAGIPVWPLELSDPHLYHLDMALAILPDHTALVCPWALTTPSLRTLEQVHGADRLIPVSRELALEFGLNLVAVGDTILVGTNDRRIGALVTSLGYRTVAVPLGQFHLAGGSAACLVATVHPDPAL